MFKQEKDLTGIDFDVRLISPCRFHASIDIVKSRVQNIISETYKNFANYKRIDGFRRGKAPRWLLKARFSEEIKEAQEISVKEIINSELHENYELFGKPKLENEIELDENESCSFSMTFETRPEIDLADISQITVQAENIIIEESETEQVLQDLAVSNSILIPKEGKSEVGDVIIADYVLMQDDLEQVAEKAGEFHVVEEKSELIGLSPGDKFSSLTKYNDAPAWIYANVIAVKRYKPAEIDDSLAEQLGETNLGEVKEKIKNEIYKARRLMQKRDLLKEIEKKYIQLHDFEISLELQEKVFNRLVAKRKRELHDNFKEEGVSPDELKTKIDERISKETKDIKEQAIWAIKRDFVFQAIIEREKFYVHSEEYENIIADISFEYGIPPETLIAFIEDKKLQNKLCEEIIFDKVNQYLYDHANVVEAVPSE